MVEARPLQANGLPVADSGFSQLLGAAQTLPLWGFSPLKKDVLVEIDGAASIGSCANATALCPADRHVYPRERPDRMPYTAEEAFQSLWNWRRAFASIPAIRANNPDGSQGIEAHFDVRFANVISNGHGSVPQTVPTRQTATGATEVFGKAGFIVYVPRGGSGSLCSCDTNFMSPDPRHAGMSRWMPGLVAGGATNCNGDIAATTFDPEETASHEFGHVLGIDHGGPKPGCFSNPFAPTRTLDVFREDKVGYASNVNYAYQSTAPRLANRDAMGGHVFSIGRNLGNPLPRPRASDGVLGWPELRPFRANSTAFVALWERVGDRARPFRPLESSTGFGALDSIDFDFDNGITDTTVTAPVEGSQALEAAATYPQELAGFLCDNGNYAPTPTRPCCPFGSTATNGQCVTPGPMGVVVPAAPRLPRTLFNLSQQGPFIARPAVGAAQRMYSLHQADLGATDTSGNPVRVWTGLGKVRWQAMDTIFPRAPETAPTQFSLRECASDSRDCSRINPGRPERGDFVVDGQPWPLNGTGTIAVATIDAGTMPQFILAATASRTCVVQTNTMTGVASECPWGPARLALGTAANLESPSAANTFRAVTIPGLAPAISGIAVTEWVTPNTFLVVTREDTANTLSFSTCTTAGVCTPSRPLEAPTGRLSSNTQIALAGRDTQIGRRVGLVWGLAIDPVRAPLVAALRFNEVIETATSIRAGTTRRIADARPGETSEVALRAESPMSATYSQEGTLVVAFESLAAALQAVGTTTRDPLDGDSRLYWGSKDSNNAFQPVFGGSRTSGQLSFRQTPGHTFALFRDTRSAAESVAPNPTTGARLADYDRAFGGAVRAWAPSFTDMTRQRFVARIGGSPLEPRYDYDDTQTIAFALCQTLESFGRGIRGSDVAPRRPGWPEAPARITCPGAAAWIEPPINAMIPDFVFRRGEFSNTDLNDAIAVLVTGRNWYGSLSPRPPTPPPRTVPIAPVDRCTASDPEGAWQAYQTGVLR